ncbi:MAG: c-type cytochrome [Bacteroidetes bacterium]|nr:c-type cytochrome [Bacteroidota bacterium]
MRKKFLKLIKAGLSLAMLVNIAFAQSAGETTFKNTCAACHTVGMGKLIGPDLANVDKRQSEAWLIKFIKSSQSVIKSGDKYADSIFKAFNQVTMPDQASLTDAQIKEVLEYIKSKSPAVTASSSTSTESTSETTSATTSNGDASRGRDLFVGKLRFSNNGPTCNSCHNVDMEGVISGGALAKDLTQAYSRLGEEGVKGVISGLPFPQMKQSYEKSPIMEQEIADIVAFLKETDKQASAKSTASVGSTMLIGGIIGVIVLLVLFSIFWIKRKSRTVNYSIYERQIKST